MTTFHTMNPVPSADAKDRYDNSENLDNLLLGSLATYLDRRDNPRLSWAGMEGAFNADQIRREAEHDADQSRREAEFDAAQADREAAFDNFILSSGYQDLGDYDSGPLIITERNQVFRKDGELWKPSASLTLPYTTVSNWAVDAEKFVSVGDAALRQELSGKTGYYLIGIPTNLDELRGLPVPVISAGRTFTIPVAGHTTARDGGDGGWYWQSNSNEADDNATVILPTGYAGVGRWKRVVTDFIRPEFFGAKGNFDWATQTGTADTAALQAALNWCNRKGSVLQPMAGKKYLSDTLRLYYDASLNPGWPGRAGRVSIVGHANGHATGALEDPGCAFVHINGAARPLIELKGLFSIENPTGMGGYFSMLNMNLVGGTSTTNVLHLQGAQGSILLQNYTVKVQNPAGNGILESTTWETSHMNGLIRGGATGDGSWTGVGLRIMSDGSTGQTNMKNYMNVDCYKMGYGTRIGRGAVSVGTFGPLNFIGGQTSLCDYHGLWLEGGVIAFTSIGYQHEGHRLNGIRIDRTLEDGVTLANDLARSVKIIDSYITGCGGIEDGSVNSYAVYVANGDGVELDGLVLNTVGNGIAFDAGEVDNLLIRRPVWRTVRTYGASVGYGIRAFGVQSAAKRIRIEQPTFNQNPAVQFDTVAAQVMARGKAGGRLSFATNSTTPSISLGGPTGSESVAQLNLNYSSAVTLDNITGGTLYQTLLITFSNTNATIPNNHSTFYLNGGAFTPANSKSILVLFFDGTTWNEVSRSLNA